MGRIYHDVYENIQGVFYQVFYQNDVKLEYVYAMHISLIIIDKSSSYLSHKMSQPISRENSYLSRSLFYSI